MAIATFQRYEKKYLLNLTQYQALLPVLEQHMTPDIYCKTARNMKSMACIMTRKITT